MIDFLIKNSLCLSFERAGEKRSQSKAPASAAIPAGGTLAAPEKSRYFQITILVYLQATEKIYKVKLKVKKISNIHIFCHQY